MTREPLRPLHWLAWRWPVRLGGDRVLGAYIWLCRAYFPVGWSPRYSRSAFSVVAPLVVPVVLLFLFLFLSR